jgi:hypothetical protein
LAPLWLSLLLALEVTIFRRPTQIESELRLLIRRMSRDNPLWARHGRAGFDGSAFSAIRFGLVS